MLAVLGDQDDIVLTAVPLRNSTAGQAYAGAASRKQADVPEYRLVVKGADYLKTLLRT